MGLRIGEPMESFVGKKGTSRVLRTRRRPSTALQRKFASLVREGFLRPGASITESEWLGASMPAGFRPAEIEHEVPKE